MKRYHIDDVLVLKSRGSYPATVEGVVEPLGRAQSEWYSEVAKKLEMGAVGEDRSVNLSV